MKYLTAFICFFALPVFATGAPMPPIDVYESYAYTNGKTAAAFFKVDVLDQTNTIINAQSPISRKVELHTHKHENGVMKMRQVEEIPLPAELKPGGYHIMFMGLHEPLKAGDEIPLTLDFSDGTEFFIHVPVKNRK